MKRKREQERDEAIAREQADARRDALLAELRAREAGVHEPEPAPAEPAVAEADAPEADAPEADAPGADTPEEDAPEADAGEPSEEKP